MNKEKMKHLIDSENGKGFSENIPLDGYNFFKNNSFISFKISKVEDVQVVIIRYIYSDNKKDLVNILAYCCNFWMGMQVKLIYYREKEKSSYAIDYLREIGFKVSSVDKYKWRNKFECIKGESPCTCRVIESHV